MVSLLMDYKICGQIPISLIFYLSLKIVKEINTWFRVSNNIPETLRNYCDMSDLI
jgi:hypothetical protein